jgi:hypothetical protein
MKHLETYILAALFAAMFLAAGALLDGQPTETEAARSVANSLQDAIQDARTARRIERALAYMPASAADAEPRALITISLRSNSK